MFSNTPTGTIWHWMFFRCFDTIVPGNLTVIFDVLGPRFLPSIQFWITTKLFVNAFALPQLFSFAKFVTFFEVVQIQNMLFVVLFPGGAFCWIQVSWSSDLTRRTVGTQGLNLSLCLFIWWRFLVGGVICFFFIRPMLPVSGILMFLNLHIVGMWWEGLAQARANRLWWVQQIFTILQDIFRLNCCSWRCSVYSYNVRPPSYKLVYKPQ